MPKMEKGKPEQPELMPAGGNAKPPESASAKEPDPFEVDDTERQSKEQAEAKAKLERLEHERDEIKAEKERLEHERQELEQKYRTAQGRLKDAAKPGEAKAVQGKTWDQYEQELDREFDADPKKAFFRLMRDTAQDLALRDVQYERKLKETEERAFRRALASDPERGKLVARIAEFDDENPDLSNLSVERKLQFMQFQSSGSKPKETIHAPSDDGDVATDLSLGGSDGNGRSKEPDWMRDPDVLREGRKAFSSKKEMMLWATDPEKARALARQRRNQQ